MMHSPMRYIFDNHHRRVQKRLKLMMNPDKRKAANIALDSSSYYAIDSAEENTVLYTVTIKDHDQNDPKSQERAWVEAYHDVENWLENHAEYRLAPGLDQEDAILERQALRLVPNYFLSNYLRDWLMWDQVLITKVENLDYITVISVDNERHATIETDYGTHKVNIRPIALTVLHELPIYQTADQGDVYFDYAPDEDSSQYAHMRLVKTNGQVLRSIRYRLSNENAQHESLYNWAMRTGHNLIANPNDTIAKTKE